MIDKKEDEKNEFERSTTLSEPALVPAVQKGKTMHWFWSGFVVSIPVSFFILGNDKHTAWLVNWYSIFFMLILAIAIFLYRKWNGLKIEDLVLKNSIAIKYITNLVMFIIGHSIGFATIHLFRNIF